MWFLLDRVCAPLIVSVCIPFVAIFKANFCAPPPPTRKRINFHAKQRVPVRPLRFLFPSVNILLTLSQNWELDCVCAPKLKNHNELFALKARRSRRMAGGSSGGVFLCFELSNGTRVSNLRRNNKCFVRDKTESTGREVAGMVRVDRVKPRSSNGRAGSVETGWLATGNNDIVEVAMKTKLYQLVWNKTATVFYLSCKRSPFLSMR